jgi:hypothetical protein
MNKEISSTYTSHKNVVVVKKQVSSLVIALKCYPTHLGAKQIKTIQGFQGLPLAILPILGLNIRMKKFRNPRGSHIIRKLWWNGASYLNP